MDAAAAPAVPKTSVPSARHEQWLRDYTVARAELTAGHFAAAARQFQALAASAEDPADARLASEQAELAASWSNRHLVLSAEGAGTPQPRGSTGSESGARSTDEISILYTNALFYGLGSGLTIAAHTETKSASGVILPALTLGGAAMGAVAIADMSPHELRYGVPQSIVSGMYIGFEEGLTWALWNQARSRYYEEWGPGTVSTLMWGGATLGAGVGALVGSLGGATPGRASFVSSASLWAGTLAGFTAGAIGAESDNSRDDQALLAAAIGVNAGAIAGMLSAGPVSPSIARVRYLDLGALGGGLLGGGLYLAAADEHPDSRALLATTAAGIGAGLVTAWVATNRMAQDLGPSARRASSIAQSLRPTFVPYAGGGGLALSGAL